MSKMIVNNIEYKSISDACRAYNISMQTYYNRLKRGKSPEEALLMEKEISNAKETIDHLGNKFRTLEHMCKYYNINKVTFKSRLKCGMDLKEALTTPINKIKRIEPIDYLGKKYKSIEDMCKYYNISVKTFRSKMHSGCTVKEALTKKKGMHANKCTDHLGNEYKGLVDMARAYNITYNALRAGMKKGKPLDEILKPRDKNKLLKTMDNKFNSIKEACEYYGISKCTFYKKIKLGYSCNEIFRSIKRENITEICKQCGISHYKYGQLIKNGYSINDIIEYSKINKKEKIKDFQGNEYNCISDMCKHYNINKGTFAQRIKRGIPLKDALLIPAVGIKYGVSKAYIGIDNVIYYRVHLNNRQIYLNCEQILEYIDKGIIANRD